MIPKDHFPSVEIDQFGKVKPLLGSLNINPGKDAPKSVMVDDEPMEKLTEHTDLFKNLRFVNLILTNACNLSCAYCYEQHNRDYGRFTLESLERVYQWLLTINPHPKKTMSFFGGEPLIHKQLILDFLESRRHNASDKIAFGMTTNGVLLSKNFLRHYFSFPNTILMVSLDTHLVKFDHRGLTEEKMAHVLDMVEYAASLTSEPARLAIRATISRENAPMVREFWTELYRRGVRQLVFHPLILSQEQGYIEWPADEWEKFASDILGIIKDYPDVKHLRFAEGIGTKFDTNCLTGSDTIAVDASGDFSGCYFFTNRKSQTGKLLLGNIFDDKIYYERYKGFQKAYDELFDQPECKTCNYKNTCYQCPAGNISTGEKLFRPDLMCKRFVKLHDDFHEAILEKHFMDKVKQLVQLEQTNGKHALMVDLANLIGKFGSGLYGAIPGITSINVDLNRMSNLLFHIVESYIRSGIKQTNVTAELIDFAASQTPPTSPKQAYMDICTLLGLPIQERQVPAILEDALYCAMLHFIVVDAGHPKGVAAKLEELNV
jgi:radical SAM protein with 4Fe4S-binding SPASM domain